MTRNSILVLAVLFGIFPVCTGGCDDDSENDSDERERVECNGELCSPSATCGSVDSALQCVCDKGYLGDGKTCDDETDWVRHQVGEQDYAIYVTTGDMDGDEKRDMIVTSSDHSATYRSEIAWYQNPGGGTDWAKHIIASAEGDDPIFATNGIAVSDIDKDGVMEVVVGTGPAPRSSTDIGGVYLFTQPTGAAADGEWNRKTVFESEGESFFKVYLVDINKDGLDDIVGGGTDAGLIALNPGTDEGDWTIDRLGPGTGGGLYIGDIDNDNDVEIISANAYSKKIVATYITQQGDTLSYTDVDIADLEWVLDVYTLDVNGDGYGDVLASRIAGAGFRWFENPTDGSGNWKEHSIDGDLSCTDIYSGDMNGDGVEDVIVSGLAIMIADPPPMSIVWFEIDREGDSIDWIKHYVDYDKPDLDAPGDVELFDMNGDGKLDIATTSMTDHLVLWYENAMD